MSISSSLIGLRNNVSCEFPTRVENFQLVWKLWSRQTLHVCGKHIAQFTSFAPPGTNLHLFATMHWLVCNPVTQIIQFAFDVHTPLVEKFGCVQNVQNGIMHRPTMFCRIYILTVYNLVHYLLEHKWMFVPFVIIVLIVHSMKHGST